MRLLTGSAMWLALVGCDQPPAVNSDSRQASAPNPASRVEIRSVTKVGLDALQMPSARVRVRNNGPQLSTVHVKCLFTDAKGEDIGDGLALFSNLAAGTEDAGDAVGGEQHHPPAKADCRVEYAHE